MRLHPGFESGRSIVIVKTFHSEIVVVASESSRRDRRRGITRRPRQRGQKEADTTALSGNYVKNSVSKTELAEWYDIQQRTIYSWLKRLDTDESLEQAVSDDKRTGRKRKLS